MAPALRELRDQQPRQIVRAEPPGWQRRRGVTPPRRIGGGIEQQEVLDDLFDLGPFVLKELLLSSPTLLANQNRRRFFKDGAQRLQGPKRSGWNIDAAILRTPRTGWGYLPPGRNCRDSLRANPVHLRRPNPAALSRHVIHVHQTATLELQQLILQPRRKQPLDVVAQHPTPNGKSPIPAVCSRTFQEERKNPAMTGSYLTGSTHSGTRSTTRSPT